MALDVSRWHDSMSRRHAVENQNCSHMRACVRACGCVLTDNIGEPSRDAVTSLKKQVVFMSHDCHTIVCHGGDRVTGAQS